MATRRRPKLYGVFVLFLIAVIVLLVGWWLLAFLSYRADAHVQNTLQEKDTLIQQLQSIEDQESYQKMAFAQTLEQGQPNLPRSEHIATLIDVLNTVQQVDGSSTDTLQLYDFQVNLDSIQISGRTSNLALLYYPKRENKQGLIATVSDLEFLDDIRIQTYEKNEDENAYEFTLYATIILDAATQQ
jgi:hypothetical protein